MADYSFIRDQNNTVVGIWFGDPSNATPEMVATALEWKKAMNSKQIAIAIASSRVVPNNFDSNGGCFVMFGEAKAPGEKAVSIKAGKPIPTQSTNKISTTSINSINRQTSQRECTSCHRLFDSAQYRCPYCGYGGIGGIEYTLMTVVMIFLILALYIFLLVGKIDENQFPLFVMTSIVVLFLSLTFGRKVTKHLYPSINKKKRKDDIKGLIDELTNPDPAIRQYVSDILIEINDMDSLIHVFTMISALHIIGDSKEVVDSLLKIYNKNDMKTRIAIANALADIGDVHIIETLRYLSANESDNDVREALSEAIKTIEKSSHGNEKPSPKNLMVAEDEGATTAQELDENLLEFGQLGLNDDGQKEKEETIKPIAALGFPWKVEYLAISSDGQLLAITTGPGIVVVQVETGEIVDAWEVGYATNILAFSPNGKWLAQVGYRDNNAIKMKDMVDKTRSYNIGAHSNRVKCLDFHPDGALASGDIDGVIKVTKSHQDCETFFSSESPVQALKFSPDGKLLLSADDSIKMWEFNNNKLLYTIEQPETSNVTFAPDGQTFAVSTRSTHDNGSISIYQTDNGQLLTTLNNIKDDYFMSVAFSPDSKLLTVSNKVWNRYVESFVYELEASSIWDHANKVFSPARNLLMVSGDKPGGWKGWSEGGVLFYSNKKLSFIEKEINL
ncbi:MAG: HEAT repeat domain-containing protein [Chloroflexota bacterium]